MNLLFMFGRSKLKIYCSCLSVSLAVVSYNRWETEQLSQYRMVDLPVCGVMYSNRTRRTSLPSFRSLVLRTETHYCVFCLFSVVKYRFVWLRFCHHRYGIEVFTITDTRNNSTEQSPSVSC